MTKKTKNSPAWNSDKNKAAFTKAVNEILKKAYAEIDKTVFDLGLGYADGYGASDLVYRAVEDYSDDESANGLFDKNTTDKVFGNTLMPISTIRAILDEREKLAGANLERARENLEKIRALKAKANALGA